jgi:two-component system nitrogen regulation response regulator NtrX
LRVLQEQRIQRVGGSRMIQVDVRVIAASNKHLEDEILRGNFREDLYYRLNVYPIVVPPLRDRADDIPVLVETFLSDFAVHNNEPKKQIAPAALDVLRRYPWPGNVRELKNLIERLTILVEKDSIGPEDIPPVYRPGAASANPRGAERLLEIGNFKEAKHAFEQEYIKRKLAGNDDNITQTAREIGVGRSYLSKRIKALKI